MGNRRRIVLSAAAGALLLLVLAGALLVARPRPVTVRVALAGSRRDSMQWFITRVENVAALVKDTFDWGDSDRRVEWVFVDTNDPANENSIERERDMLETLLAEDRGESLVAVWGAGSSGEARNTIPLLNRYGVTLVSSFSTWPGLTKPGYVPGEPLMYYPSGPRNFFRVVPSDEVQGQAAARWVGQQGYATVYIVRQDTVYSRGIADIFVQYAKDYGVQIVGDEVIDIAAMQPADFDALATRVIAASPALVYYPGNLANTYSVPTALRQQNPDLPIFGGDGLRLEAVPTEAALLESIYVTFYIPPLDKIPSAEVFRSAYEARFEEPPPDFTLPIYDALRAILQAVKQADQPTREGVRRAMSNLGPVEGAMGRWKFDANGDIDIATINLLQLRSGEWESVGVIQSTNPGLKP